MKAAVYKKYGPPEVVNIQQISTPEPKASEVLIKVGYTTVNRTDCGFRSAQYFISRLFSGLFTPRIKVLGCEFSGEVVKTGSAVSTYHIGEKVFGFDDTRFGGHAEYKIIKATGAMTTIPANADLKTAAALTEGSHYALSNIRAAKVKKGDVVLVYGATGAIGSAAVQLLKYFGAYVVAVAPTRHLQLIQSIGADEVIDYLTTGFTKTAHRFNFIFDAVGKSSFRQCKPLLKKNGIYISTELGKRSENIFLALSTPLWNSHGKKVLFPLPFIKKEDVLFLKKLTEEGAFQPVIDREYPLDEIVDAYRYVETQQKLGNVIISVAEK